MKKILSLVCLVSFIVPAFAATDIDTKMQKEQQKYQLKQDKIKKQRSVPHWERVKECYAFTRQFSGH